MLSLIWFLQLIALSYGGKKCAYLGMEGIGYPTDTCMFQAQTDPSNTANDYSFAFEFLCGGKKVSAEYWESKTECTNKPDLEMDDYYCAEDPQLTGQECKCVGRGKACDTFTIKTAKSNDADSVYGEEECSASLGGDQLTSIVINECIPTGYGGAMYFQCDDTMLEMQTFQDCDNCKCAGDMQQFDYSYLNKEHCLKIKCISGSRKIKKCKNRGVKAAEINGYDAQNAISQHITSHHLFIKDIITKHQLKQNGHINNWDIFGNDSIWKYHKLFYGLSVIVIVMILTSIISCCRWNSQYSKI